MLYTTAADRVQIVQDCLANGCDYGATALKYNVDYKALVNWVGRYRAHGPAACTTAATAARGTRRAPRAVRAPWRRCSALSLCWTVWKTGKLRRYGAENTLLRTIRSTGGCSATCRDGWLGMNDRRGPADDPGPEGERVAPPMRTPQKMGGPVRGRAGRPARPAAPRRVQLVRDCKNFV